MTKAYRGGDTTAKRRYSLPEGDAEIVRLALRFLIHDLQEGEETLGHTTEWDVYWQHTRVKAQALLKKLDTYKWEKE